MTPSPTSKAGSLPNKRLPDADTQAARLAYAAFEGLCGASCMSTQPILHDEAVKQRDRSVDQLRQALALLEPIQ